MDIAEVLRDILIVLVAAKAAAELAERAGIPAVVGEIVAGIFIGPSVLGLVGTDEVLRTLGEIGVILLLLEVGIEMDLKELGKVGKASMLVATVGVVTPMVLGIGVMQLISDDFNTGLFVGAALTATSVGITARVFGDLRALATVEARTVLGAAVADDVMGLVVLTVVVRIVTEGSVSLLSVLGIVAVALAFLVLGAIVGLRLAPPLFGLVERFSRSTGTLVAIALAFTLGFAELASAAKLAPIVGAFVAGIALSRSEQSGRVRRELAPVGHLFIPVFFLQIGIDADIGAFTSGAVLRDAGLLLGVAVVGKLVSPIGAIGSPGDKTLIGLGMLPRGEVGLIFATIGLQNGVLDRDLYAALLLVVLVTTLAAPQLLKLRYQQLRSRLRDAQAPPADAMPIGGWLRVSDGEVELAAQPRNEPALLIALQAAIRVGWSRPGERLLAWLASLPDDPLEWDQASTDALFALIERGNARSWRFLDNVGVLERALPEVAEGLRARGADHLTLDPLESHRFSALERLRRLDAGDPLAFEIDQLKHIDRLLLGLLLAEALEARRRPGAAARSTACRIGMTLEDQAAVAALVDDRDLLWAAAHRPAGLAEPAVLQLASHLDTPERARASYILTALRAGDAERWELARLDELHQLIERVLANEALHDGEARNVVDRRREDVRRLVGSAPGARARLEHAPRSYLLRQEPATIARQLSLVSEVPPPRTAYVSVADADDCRWIDVGLRDRAGLLAAVTGVLARRDLEIVHATIATWPDGAALESFCVTGPLVDAETLRRDIEARFDAPLLSPPLPDAVVSFDDQSSPWHTVCEVAAPDEPGLLHELATAFAAAGVAVIAANVASNDGIAYDRFELTDGAGAKLSEEEREAVLSFVRGGVMTVNRRFRRAVPRVAVPV
jgi:Kef-type K+ transport system membrane component KefB/predicted amino acid-binding ACT domain protein